MNRETQHDWDHLEVDNAGVSLHVMRRKGSDADKLPFVYVPGLSGTAEDGMGLFDAFRDRLCISMSLRGRGRSSTPTHGYATEDHASDICSVLDALKLTEYCIHPYSIATAYVAKAIEMGLMPTGLIIGDHAPTSKELSPDWVAWFSGLEVGGKPVVKNIRLRAIKGIQESSEDSSFFGCLSKGTFPVLLLRATGEGTPTGMISNGQMGRYERVLGERLSVEPFEQSGHFLRVTEEEKYISTIADFLRRLESSSSRDPLLA